MQDGPEQEARDEIFTSQLGKEITGAFPSRWFVSPLVAQQAFISNYKQDVPRCPTMDIWV
jgi:hypothetical protein